MVNDSEKGIASQFCRYAGNKTNRAVKDLNTTNINTKGAALNRKIDLSFDSLSL